MKMSKMKKNRKKLFAILLQAALVSTAMTMPAYAAKTPGIGSDARIGDDATGPVLTGGNTVAVLDELYLWLSNPVAIEYIRNCLKRVRKRDSALIMASQNLEDFDQEGVREMTKPLFAIPPHQFLFNPGSIGKRFYMDMLQLDEAEFELIQRARRGECLYKCGMERYHLEVKAPTHKAVLFGSAGGR